MNKRSKNNEEYEGISRKSILERAKTSSTLPRRTVISGVCGGISLSILGSVSGQVENTPGVVVSDTEEGKELLSEYSSPEKAESEANRVAEDLLQYLSDNGYLATNRISINSVKTDIDQLKKGSDTYLTVQGSTDYMTSRFEVSMNPQGAGDLTVFVLPEREKSFATFQKADYAENEIKVIDVDRSVTESYCLVDRVCKYHGGGREQEIICCDYGDPNGTCYFGETFAVQCDCIDWNDCCILCDQCDVDPTPCTPDP